MDGQSRIQRVDQDSRTVVIGFGGDNFGQNGPLPRRRDVIGDELRLDFVPHGFLSSHPGVDQDHFLFTTLSRRCCRFVEFSDFGVDQPVDKRFVVDGVEVGGRFDIAGK